MGNGILPRAALTGLLVAVVPLVSACGANDAGNADVIAGKQLFVSKCGSCHTLARAGTKGTVGPNLDEAFRQSIGDGMGRSVAVEPRSLMLPPHYFSKEHNIVAGVLLGRQFNPLLPSKFDTGTDAGDPDSAEQQSANRREKETI